MIVVSDTGPLHYLFRIGALDILPALYGQIITPLSVVSIELNDPATPEPLRAFFRTPPAWLIVHQGPASIDPSLVTLGVGEGHAISLMLGLKGHLLLCDDYSARTKATRLGVPVIGTLGLIDEAAYRGLVDFDSAIERLTKNTNFRHTQMLITQVRELHQARLKIRKD